MAYAQKLYTFPHGYADAYRISYNCEELYNPNADIHTHNCDEILLVRQGNLRNHIGNEVICYNGSCIIYKKQGDPHLTLNIPGILYKRYCIRYSRSVLEKQQIQLPIMNSFLCPIGDKDEILFTYAELLLQEYTPLNHSAKAEQAKTHLLASLLIKIFETAQEYSMSTLPTYCAYIRSVLQYIFAHYHENLTLDNISRRFYVGKTKLCRDFRTYTGTSLAAYVTNLRMEHAKDFLLTGNSVRKTAELVGYEYESNFIHVFSKTTGVTPLQFKRNANT